MMDLPLLFIEMSASHIRDLHPKQAVSEVPKVDFETATNSCVCRHMQTVQTNREAAKPCSCWAHEPVELQFAGEHGVASGRFDNSSKGVESA